MVKDKKSKEKETASSASSWATFKEEMPKRLHVSDVWMNQNKLPPQYGTRLESAAEPGGTLLGRLAMRMTSRDLIDNLNLGPKAQSGESKKARIADMSEVTTKKPELTDMSRTVGKPKTFDMNGVANMIPSKMMLGGGLHQQMKDLKASNFSNPIPNGNVLPGSNMADQAKAAGNIYNTPFDALGKNIIEKKHK